MIDSVVKIEVRMTCQGKGCDNYVCAEDLTPHSVKHGAVAIYTDVTYICTHCGSPMTLKVVKLTKTETETEIETEIKSGENR